MGIQNSKKRLSLIDNSFVNKRTMTEVDDKLDKNIILDKDDKLISPTNFSQQHPRYINKSYDKK